MTKPAGNVFKKEQEVVYTKTELKLYTTLKKTFYVSTGVKVKMKSKRFLLCITACVNNPVLMVVSHAVFKKMYLDHIVELIDPLQLYCA